MHKSCNKLTCLFDDPPAQQKLPSFDGCMPHACNRGPKKHSQHLQKQAGDTRINLCFCAPEPAHTHCACKRSAECFSGKNMAHRVRWHLLGSQRKGLQLCWAGCKASLAKCNSHWHRICTCLVTGAYSKARRGSLPKNMGNPATPTGRLRM